MYTEASDAYENNVAVLQTYPPLRHSRKLACLTVNIQE